MKSTFFNILLALSTGLTSIGSVNAQEVEWEVANRFAPFVTQGADEQARAAFFDRFKMLESESYEEWHKRLASPRFQSPYLTALAGANSGNRMHWDQTNSVHDDAVLKFVKHEDEVDTTIGVRLSLEREGECEWAVSFGDETKNTNKTLRKTSPCNGEGVIVSIPLSGAKVFVTSGDFQREHNLNPKHVVIVGLGDSYGSGEGNPDFPGVWKSDIKFNSERDFLWLSDKNNLKFKMEAYGSEEKRWIDDNCHRSFFSHQSLLAFRLASQEKHSFVSFLHYACTGAEIFDGILVPQYQAWVTGADHYVSYSQLNFAMRDLCRPAVDEGKYFPVTSEEKAGINLNDFHRRGGEGNNSKRPSNLEPGDKFSRKLGAYRRNRKISYPDSGFLGCPVENIRKPDHVFLSIGGNDFGFGDVVKYYIVPSIWSFQLIAEKLLFPDICPSPANRVSNKSVKFLHKYCKNKDGQKGAYHAGDIVTGNSNGNGSIKQRLTLLTNILNYRLGVENAQILMPQYPDAVRKLVPSEDACAELDMNAFLKRLPGKDGVAIRKELIVGDLALKYSSASPWNGLKSATPRIVGFTPAQNNIEKWQFNFTHWDAFLAVREFEVLRPKLAEAATGLGINFVCSTRDAFLGYDFEQGSRRNLPNGVGGDPAKAWNASEWDPYIYEVPTRAVRTGNDTALTQPGDKQITGAVHPNLTGHRLIAEEMYKAMRRTE